MAFKQRKLVEIEFAQPGEVLDGYLLSATTRKYQDGGTNISYLVKRHDGVMLAFQGSAMLNKLLHISDIGCAIRVKYVGLESRAIASGMNPKKVFEVEVDEENKISGLAATPGGDPGITDLDIPF